MSGDMIFTAYLTRYALTRGIRRAKVSLDEEFPELVTVVGSNSDHHTGEGKEWHRTAATAIAHAEEMRVAKIASLKKQIAKLEKMEFRA